MEDQNHKQQEEIETERQDTDNDPVAFAEFTSKDSWEEYQVNNFSVIAISEVLEVKNSVSLAEDDLNGHIVKLKTKTDELILLPTPEAQCYL